MTAAVRAHTEQTGSAIVAGSGSLRVRAASQLFGRSTTCACGVSSHVGGCFGAWSIQIAFTYKTAWQRAKTLGGTSGGAWTHETRRFCCYVLHRG
eukprot:scaffold8935_cov69-Phaeocystis_antarctica.AAC.2